MFSRLALRTFRAAPVFKRASFIPFRSFAQESVPRVEMASIEEVNQRLEKIRRILNETPRHEIYSASTREWVGRFEREGLIDPVSDQEIARLNATWGDEFKHEQDSIVLWQKFSMAAIGIIILTMVYLVVKGGHHAHREIEYPHMRIRNKTYPWGDRDLLDFSHDEHDDHHDSH